MKNLLVRFLMILGVLKPYVGLAASIEQSTPIGSVTIAGECRECGGGPEMGGRGKC